MDVTFKNVEPEDFTLLKMLAKRLGIEIEITKAIQTKKSDPISNIDVDKSNLKKNRTTM